MGWVKEDRESNSREPQAPHQLISHRDRQQLAGLTIATKSKKIQRQIVVEKYAKLCPESRREQNHFLNDIESKS